MQNIEVKVEYHPLNRSYGDMKNDLVSQFEQQFVKVTLAEFNGNLSAAARTLKMDRKYLYELVKKHRASHVSG